MQFMINISEICDITKLHTQPTTYILTFKTHQTLFMGYFHCCFVPI